MWSGSAACTNSEQDFIICGQKFGLECPKNAQRKGELQWAIDKQKLVRERLRGTYFIDKGFWSFKETIENVRKKLELIMEAAIF